MEFIRLQQNHVNQVIDISNKTLGDQYLTESSLQNYINSPTNFGFVMVQNEIVLGFTSIVILTPQEFKQTVLKDNDWFYFTTKEYSKIAWRKQLVVNPYYMNKGIGSKLYQLSSKAIEQKSNAQICTAWKNDNNSAMINLLVKSNFKHIKTIKNYWNNDSIKNNYNCLICGKPPCKCSVDIYIKKNASA